jgi:PAS domain S-box-containing protein
MKNSFLRERYLNLIRAMRSDLGLYRMLTVIVGIAIPAYGFVLPQGGFDPMWARLSISGFLGLVFAASYLFKVARNRIRPLGHLTIYLLTAWACWLVVQNDYATNSLVHFFLVLIFSASNFKSFRGWAAFAGSVIVVSLVACIRPNPANVDLWPYLLLLFLSLVGTAFATGFMIMLSEELQRQRNRVTSIFENSPDAILMANIHTLEVRNTNQIAQRMFGVGGTQSPAMLNQHLTDWLKAYLAGKEGIARIGRGITQVQRLTGETLWVEVLVTELASNYRPEYLVSLSDITDRQQIAQRLQLADDVLQQVDHIVLVSDPDANIVYATPSVKSILHYEIADVLGQGWWDIKRRNGDKVDASIAYLKAYARGQAPAKEANYEVRHIDGQGKEQWVLWKDSLTANGFVMGVGMLHTRARRDETVRSAIFSIAEASSKAKTPSEFYHIIHQEIRRLIDTPNFYVAVYNSDTDEVSFPYYSDTEDDANMARVTRKRKAANGLTEYGIKRQKPVLLLKQDMLDLMELGQVSVMGSTPEVWLGVPMIHDGEVVGLITIQDYERPNAYSQDDLTLVNFVASQVAQFVAKLQADEALRLSEERFRSIYKQAAVGIAQLTPDGKFLQVNQQMAEIFGYSVEELLELMPMDFTHPDDLDLGREELIEVMEGLRPSYSKEKRYIHKDGHTVYALLNVSAYRENGEPIFVISVYEDITEKKRAQGETELLLRLSSGLNTAESIEDAVAITLEELAGFDDWGYAEACWLDLAGQYRACAKNITYDDAFAQVKGAMTCAPPTLASQTLSGKVIWGHEPEAAIFQEAIAVATKAEATTIAILPILDQGKAIVVILLLSRKEGIYRQSLEKLAGAVRSQLLAVHLRKREEAARIESENRYRAITQAAFEGIAIHQGNRILDCNSAFARVFDYTPAEINSITLDQLIYDDAPEKLVMRLDLSDASAIEFMGRKKGGESLFMEAISRQDQWQGQEARILAVRDITSQKLMEDAREVARLDARFKAYIQNSAEIIKIIDIDGRIQYCSPSYSKLFGTPAEEVVGMLNADLMAAEDRAGYLLALNEVRRQPQASQQLQLQFPSATGVTRILQAKLTNLIEDPMIKGILISEGDITHVIEAQQSRQESEQRFKLLFERSPDAIFVESEAGYILDVNDAACALHEMTREELMGKHVAELTPPENREAVVAGFKELMRGTTSYLQGESLTKSGKIVEVEIRCNVIHVQNQPALLLLVRDISQRKKEELLLKESEERFRALVEHATEAIFVIDIAGDRLIEANKNAETLFERSRESLMSISPSTLSATYQASGDASSTLQPQLYARALAGEMVVYEWLFQNVEGEEIPCEIRLLRFPSATQQLVRASVTDITARKQAELKMQRSREILRIQNERLIELAASDALNSGDLDIAFEEITQAIAELLHVTLAGVWLFDASAEHLVCRKEYNSEKGLFLSGREVLVSEYPRYFALMDRQRVIAEDDAMNSENISEFLEKSLRPNNIRSVLDAPFRHGGRIAGMIWTMQMHEVRHWEPEELQLLASMADMVTLAMQSSERKKAETELANTLTKMQATFESTRDGILLLDPQGYLLDYNEEYCKLSHIPKTELDSGQPYPGQETMLGHIVEFEQFREAFKRIEAQPDAEERFVYQTYSDQVIEMYGRQLLVEGQHRGMLWFLHDITDLKRIEKALLENETKFRSLFSQANDAIILLNGSTFIECNNKAEEMWGLTREQLIGKKSFELSPELQPDGQRSMEKAATNTAAAYNGVPQRFYWQHTRGDGQPFDAEVSLNRIQIGDKVYIQALVRDITERLKTENALRESEHNNKALLDGIPDLILRITRQGLILDYKQSDQQSQLRVIEGAVGRSIAEVLPATFAAMVLEQAAKAVQESRSLQFESELKLDGEDMDYETRIVPSGPDEVLAIIRDVTERKRTEKELIKRNFELDSFVYRASHDLKAPLNSLMGLITLVEGETHEPQVLAYIKMMNKSVVKLDSFIRDLADFSRNARLELLQSQIDWDALLQETLENLQFADGADRIQKNIHLGITGAFYSDPVRIGIIFNNLVSNAIKYQNLKRADAKVDITIERDGDYAVITIADNGIGISQEHHHKVYNLFFRASIQSYGSGMGMYIVKHAIDRIKGTIEMQSAEGQGTIFTVRFPDLGPPAQD